MSVRIIAASLVLAFLASHTFAITGPPTAGFEPGQWYAGADFLYSVQDLDTIKATVSRYDYIDDVTYPYSGITRYKVRTFNLNRYYGQLGYGMSDSWEVYGQLGLVDIQADYKEIDNNDSRHSTDFDPGFAYGLGTKFTLAKQEKVDWGVVFQMDWYSADGDYTYAKTVEDAGFTYAQTAKNSFRLDATNLFVAIGPTINMGVWKLYGGPYYHYFSAEQDFTEEGAWVGEDNSSGTWIKEESRDFTTEGLGGYIGAQVDVLPKCRLTLEFLGTQDDWGLNTGIVILF